VGGLVSGEGVALDLARAGVGSRIVAAGLDLLVQLGALLVLLIVDGVVGAGDDALLTALVLVELVLVVAGYPIVAEWLTRGRTLGKAAMGLRVVRDDGGPIAFRQALVRGLAGLLIEKPGLLAPLSTAAGLLTMVFSSTSKRIGDFMAGTFVVNERAAAPSALMAPVLEIPPPLRGWAASLDLTRLDDQLALGLRQFVLRASQFSPAAREGMGADFRSRVLAVISPPPPAGTPTPALLVAVLAERRRRSELR
jgi:uncharacterized RDD family membrane protein YckC